VYKLAELLSVTGSFVTEGGKRAAEVLKQLPDSWLIICNKTLPTRSGRSHEMDFVVVGKHWVFLLDEKSWRGKVRGNDELWIRIDDSSERSPLAKVEKADYLETCLRYALAHQDDIRMLVASHQR
jgi:Nuclease-related domain